MAKTLILVIVLLAVGYLVVRGLVGLYLEVRRAEDDERNARRDEELSLREAKDDLLYEEARTARFDGLKKGKKK